jgi:S-adenosylmethionine:tRNA ribosyltransferase-isomerase
MSRLLLCLLRNLLRGALHGLGLLAKHAGLGRFGRGLLLKLLDAAGGVDQLLLAGVKRMAAGTQFNVDFFHGGTGRDNVATGADDLRLRKIGRMDIRLHSAETIAKAAPIDKSPALATLASMKTSDFDYSLPPNLIAQTPIRPRDHSRLMVLDRKTNGIEHRRFFEIGNFLNPGDLLIVNDSKVFKARLMTVDGIEIFLLRPTDAKGVWLALAKPGRKLAEGTLVHFQDGATASVVTKHDDGTVEVNLGKDVEDVFRWTDEVGSVPVPPYVSEAPKEAADYQTVYADRIGSVAAPTAGFHFTPELIENLKAKGVRFANVTLHVGLGTFRPMKTETIEEHEMHEEWIDVPEETVRLMEETRKNGGRVIAVGTTTVRTLESETRHGFTKVFITPGHRFKNVDALITNFHLPKSTLLVLVTAFAGQELVRRAYDEAVKDGYRFFSFGDAMLIR